MFRSLKLKICAIALLLTTLVLGGYALWKNTENRDAERLAKIAAMRESKPENTNATAVIVDSDSDGLSDFEEKLWNTDPNNPDSDKDGTNDGNEVAQNRDPRKKGPDDALPFSTEQKNQNVPSASHASLPTSDNSSIGSDNQNQTTVSQPIEPKKQPSQTSTQTADTSQIALKTYGNKAGESLLPFAKEWQKELISFTNAIKGTSKEEAKEKLLGVANGYRGRANALIAITPPSELSELHQDLIVKYENQAKNIELIAGAIGSGVSGEEWKIYNTAVEAAGKAFVAVALFFKERGIIFNQNEGGAVFNLPSY